MSQTSARNTQRENTTGMKKFDLRLMMRLLGFLKPYRRLVALTFVLIFTASVARQAGPYLTKIAVDDYIVPGKIDGLDNVVWVYIVLLVLQFIMGYAQNWTTTMVGQWAMRDVRMKIFEHFQRLPQRFFDRTPIGNLMARNTSDVDALNELFTDGIVSMLSEMITIFTILGFIFYLDVSLGIFTSLILPLTAAAIFWFHRRSFHAFRTARGHYADFSASLQETLSGMEVVQLFNSQRRNLARFEEGNDNYLKDRLTSSLYHSIYFPIMESSGILLMAFILWYGSGEVLRQSLEWGVLVAMLQYVPRFFMPIRDIAEQYATIQVAMASSERIFELMDTETEPTGGDQKPDKIEGAIEFRNVWFAYESEDWVLRDVSFRAAPGQSLALVGATGAGKSTIINLICRLYDIQKGVILIDGIDIRAWDIENLRRHIGVVQQDVFLFSGDIESNISLGDSAISQAHIAQAARYVNADRFIERLPDGYHHQVAERGAAFSTGQRQLLSFARALAAEPDILVLDEATASVDTETEMWIQEAIEKIMRDRTSIVIAHRLSTIRSADKILVMHHGRIREEGRHEELLAKKGIYHRLHQLQYSEG
ncbi:MAG: ABC transporter ATP-binding protein [Candidatus Latescibacteria bacterium]|nr:ABC transporter ATP-binding protein [Candidatus Latescibacterota bacterium]